MNAQWDVVVIGSGINSLVCAAELALKGRRVLVLERDEVAGGYTEESTTEFGVRMRAEMGVGVEGHTNGNSKGAH